MPVKAGYSSAMEQPKGLYTRDVGFFVVVCFVLFLNCVFSIILVYSFL